MDRIETYIGQSILEWAFSKPDQNKMVALGKLATLVLGTGTAVNGLACTPQSPASMFVSIGAGEIYQQESLEATVCGTLPADTAHQITKQGIALDAVVVPNLNTGVTAFNPPGTSGQSINYLIQATYADQDVSVDPTTGNTPIVLPFFNSANPTQPYQGPNNSGQSSNTFRKGAVSIQVKAGVAAATGSQVTPAPDAGFVGLWVITVPFGAGSLTSTNIAAYPGSPTLPSSLVQSIVTNNLTYGVDVGSANVYRGVYPLPPTALADNMTCWLKVKTANTGAATFTPNAGVIPPAPVVGLTQSALQGGEYVVGGRALHIWRADISSWVLAYCTGGALQVAAATQSEHAIQLGQVSSAILQASETLQGTAKVATTALAQALTDDNTIITPKKLSDAFKGANQGIVSANNFVFQKLPGGIIIQALTATFGIPGTNTPFPVAFPTKCLAVLATAENGGTPAYFSTNHNAAGFTLWGSVTNVTYSMIAIGF